MNLGDYANQNFYGFRVNPDTSSLVVEVLTGDIPVVLPQEGFIDRNDYQQWEFSDKAMQFSWNKGHLKVKVL